MNLGNLIVDNITKTISADLLYEDDEDYMKHKVEIEDIITPIEKEMTKEEIEKELGYKIKIKE